MSWKHFVKLLAGKGRRRLSFICLICDNALFVFLYCEFSSLSAAFSLIFMKFAKISCKKISSRFQFDDFNHVRNYWSKISSLSPGDVFYFARVLNKNTILSSSSSMCDGEGGVEMKLIWKRTFFQLRMLCHSSPACIYEFFMSRAFDSQYCADHIKCSNLWVKEGPL